MDLSIIIVNYKTPELVLSCIESIEQNAPYNSKLKEIAYEEETDLMYRLKLHGYYTVCVPQVRILHLGGGSSSSTMRQLYWGLISRAKFIQKYHSRFYLMVCNVLHFCACFTIMFAGYVMKNHELRKLWL